MSSPILSDPVVAHVLGLVDTVGPLLLGPEAAAFTGIAQTVLGLANEAFELFPDPYRDVLAPKRDELDALIASVNGHAEATMDALKGD